jgi:hypothetical protein
MAEQDFLSQLAQACRSSSTSLPLTEEYQVLQEIAAALLQK